MARELRIGEPVRRIEDERLVQGSGRYTDDVKAPDALHLHVVRSPHAAARLVAVDPAAALSGAGVHAVLTGSMLRDAGLGFFSNRIRRLTAQGAPMFEPPRGLLADGHVRYVGEPVVAIVADSVAAAKDAADLLEIDWEPCPAVPDIETAIVDGAPTVWPEVPDNRAFLFRIGDHDGAARTLASAAHRVALDIRVNRVAASPLEPRAALAGYDAVSGRWTLHVSTQTPHSLRAELARNILHVPLNRLRVIAPDVGGAFGMKGNDYAEYGLVLWAAKLTNRPVRWTSERIESFLGDHHARDNLWRVELGLDRDGNFLAARARSYANLGAYLAYAGTHQATNNVGSMAGVYRTRHLAVEVIGVHTNTSPVAPYRGAGRPEALMAMERIIDHAAATLGRDRIDLRRRNLIGPDQMPYETGLVFTYDCGDFPGAFERVLTLSDWQGFAARREEARARGRLRGIGFAFAIEVAGGPPGTPFEEHSEIRVDASGGVTLLLGTHNHGQGHETAFRQIAAQTFGVTADQLQVLYGDTDLIAHGRGTFGSRSMSSGGTALLAAADKVITKAKRIAAHRLEAAADDVEFNHGVFGIAGTDRRLSWQEVAAAAYAPATLPAGMEPGLNEAATVTAKGPTFPNCAHVSEIEIDPETGEVHVVGYWAVDDVGRVINPLLLHGQIQGGVVQGIGQALMEDLRYEADGQLVTASFMDYAMPRASDSPTVTLESRPVPTKMNPLGAKGAGEAGTVGALPATINAIIDALRPLGIADIPMPATPERIWRAIHEQRPD